MASLKEYLKRYESAEQDQKKKKKKKNSSKSSAHVGVLIVDEDPVWAKQVAPDAEDEPEEETPVVDEDVEVKRLRRLEELRARKPYHSIAEDGSGWVSIPSQGKVSTVSADGSDLSPPRQRRARFDTPSPEPRDSKKLKSVPEIAPSTSSADDLSPPRRRESLPRDKDLSPQRRKKKVVDEDMSPMRHDIRGAERDLSPPRRKMFEPKGEDSKPQRSKNAALEDLSPPRRRRDPSAELSAYPKRTTKGLSEDLSPPRRDRKGSQKEFSARREKRISSEDISPIRREKDRQGNVSAKFDSSPLRKSKDVQAASREERRAGLFTGLEVKEEIDRKKKEEVSRFAAMDPSLSGKGAEPVYRDKEGKRITKEELESQKVKEKPKEMKLEWGKGLVQKREAEARLTDLELEKEKPFARSKDDPELDKMLRERMRWGDPMAHLVKKKQSSLPVLEDLGDDEKMKESGFIIPQAVPVHSWLKRGIDPPANRYGIRPGRHWDGVDRSNGFEKQMFQRQNERQATQTEAYLWSVSDM